MGALLEGISWGLILAVLAGPTFFKIVQVSIERGLLAGNVLAAGQWLSDLMYISIVFWGTQYVQLLNQDPVAKNQFMIILGGTGSIIIAIMGLKMLLSRATPSTEVVISKTDYLSLFSQGFLINTINPFPLFFWFSLMGNALSKSYDQSGITLVFVGTLSTVMVTDFLKAFLAKSIRKWLTPKFLFYLNRVVGGILIGFSLLLAFQVYQTVHQ